MCGFSLKIKGQSIQHSPAPTTRQTDLIITNWWKVQKITFHDSRHGFVAEKGTSTAQSKAKLQQQTVSIKSGAENLVISQQEKTLHMLRRPKLRFLRSKIHGVLCESQFCCSFPVKLKIEKIIMVDFSNKVLNFQLIDTSMNRRCNRMILQLKVVPLAQFLIN